MSTPSASPAERGILVWDAPVRVFHWLMVLCFAGAWLTAESERWRLVHVTLGYTMAALVTFRIAWGVFGTRHARFSSFVRGPRAVWRYLTGLVRGSPEHHTGHNPAGALAIVALLVLTLVVTGTGWAVYAETGGEWLEDVHEALASLMLGLVAVHVVAVALSSWLHRENLVRAMFTGRKAGRADEAARRPWHGIAALMLAAVAAFWWVQWEQAPGAAGSAVSAGSQRQADDDD
ncbi:MAG: cytochrome b/b6 domain-containing protein [Burkholderiales bacterium]|nr:cytochrome b/b6 domain-containing protein [Burkholderiales bacterium]